MVLVNSIDETLVTINVKEELKTSFYTGIFEFHCRNFINRLLRNNKNAKAWSVCEFCISRNSEFLLKEGEDILSLTTLELDKEQKVRLKSLISRFVKSEPEHYLKERLLLIE